MHASKHTSFRRRRRIIHVERSSAAAAVRARLKHPVIDSDGHWVEFGPQMADYLRQVGGAKAVEGFKSRPTEDWHLTIQRENDAQ